MKDRISIVIFITLSVVCMTAMYHLEGVQHSISRYSLYPSTSWIFKCWMLLLAYGASQNKLMYYALFPAIAMAAFDSQTLDPVTNAIHDVSAIIFFVYVTISYIKFKPTQVTGVALALSFLAWPFVGFFNGEMLTIFILHVHFMYKIFKIRK